MDAVERRSRIVQHPANAKTTPLSTCAEAVGIAQAGQMVDCIVMWTDERGNIHIGWSAQSNADLAAYGVVLTHIAGSRLLEIEE